MANSLPAQRQSKCAAWPFKPWVARAVVIDFPVERIYRDVRVCQIDEGTSGVQKIIIQRALA